MLALESCSIGDVKSCNIKINAKRMEHGNMRLETRRGLEKVGERFQDTGLSQEF